MVCVSLFDTTRSHQDRSGYLNDEPSLLRAVFCGDKEQVKSSCSSQSNDVNHKDAELRTPLHAAAYCNEEDITQMLIDNNAKVDAICKRLLTPAHIACAENSHLALKVLLESNCNINLRDEIGQSPLHIAAAFSSLACVELLLDCDAAVDVTDKFDRQPLHNACLSGCEDVVTLLLKNNADVHARDKRGRTPLHYAAYGGFRNICRALLKRGQPSLVNFADYDGCTAAHCAICCSNDAILSLLVFEFDADVNTRNANGNSLAHYCCIVGSDQCLKALLRCERFSKSTFLAQNKDGMTALHLASFMKDSEKCVQVITTVTRSDLMTARTTLVTTVDAERRLPLHYAAAFGHLERVERLARVNKLESMNTVDRSGCSPLHLCVKNPKDNIISWMLSNGSDPSLTDGIGLLPALIAALQGATEHFGELVEKTGRLVVGAMCDKFGRNVVHAAAVGGCFRILELALDCAAEAHFQTSQARRKHRSRPADSELQAEYSKLSDDERRQFRLQAVRMTDRDGLTALHYAAAKGIHRSIDLLLRYAGKLEDSDVNARDANGACPVHYAAASADADSKCLPLLVKHGARLAVADRQGMTPLHYACLNAQYFGCDALLRDGADELRGLVTSGARSTPLHIAAAVDAFDCVSELLDYIPELAECRDHSGRTALQIAAARGHLSSLKVLVEKGEPDGYSGKQALFNAIRSGSAACVRYILLDCKFPTMEECDLIDICDEHGRTPLMIGASLGSYTICHLLVSYLHADVTIADKNGRTALHRMAAGRNDALHDVVEIALAAGADPLAADKNLRRPAHLAAYVGNHVTLRMLAAKAGADIDCADRWGLTPLHLAAFAGREECVAVLTSDSSAGRKAGREYRLDALHAAAMGGSLAAVSHLMSLYTTDNASFDIATLLDFNRRTPLHYAAYANMIDCLDALLNSTSEQKRAAVMAAVDSAGLTALHYAAFNGHIESIERLFALGAEYPVSDSVADSPLHLAVTNNYDNASLAIISHLSRRYSGSPTTLAAALDRTDAQGHPALYYACRNGLAVVVHQLLRSGANPLMSGGDDKPLSILRACCDTPQTADCMTLVLMTLAPGLFDVKSPKPLGHPVPGNVPLSEETRCDVDFLESDRPGFFRKMSVSSQEKEPTASVSTSKMVMPVRPKSPPLGGRTAPVLGKAFDMLGADDDDDGSSSDDGILTSSRESARTGEGVARLSLDEPDASATVITSSRGNPPVKAALFGGPARASKYVHAKKKEDGKIANTNGLGAGNAVIVQKPPQILDSVDANDDEYY